MRSCMLTTNTENFPAAERADARVRQAFFLQRSIPGMASARATAFVRCLRSHGGVRLGMAHRLVNLPPPVPPDVIVDGFSRGLGERPTARMERCPSFTRAGIEGTS